MFKMKKRCQVIMLPSNSSGYKNRIAIVDNHLGFYNSIGAGQYLYILSDDEIKEGDWILNTYAKMNNIFQVRRCDLDSMHNRNGYWRKIIATTDSSLMLDYHGVATNDISKQCYSLPQPSQSFIKEYIEAGGIEWVDVEYEYFTNATLSILDKILQPKVNSNNEIIIHPIEEKMYSKDEVATLIRRAFAGVEGKYEIIEPLKVNKWIKENLK